MVCDDQFCEPEASFVFIITEYVSDDFYFPTEDNISIIGMTSRGDGRLLTLEVLFIKELTPVLNTKNEYRSRTLTVKF